MTLKILCPSLPSLVGNLSEMKSNENDSAIRNTIKICLERVFETREEQYFLPSGKYNEYLFLNVREREFLLIFSFLDFFYLFSMETKLNITL